MLNGNTLFVVGAGASKEFNLPIGSELNSLIRRRLTLYDAANKVHEPNRDLLLKLIDLARSLRFENYHLVKIAVQIKDGLPHAKSIDNFIRTHNNNPDLARICKLVIADVIAQCERDSLLLRDGSYKPYFGRDAQPDTWLDVLTRNMFADLALEDLPEELSKLKLICFNYDRCIEVYLSKAIQRYFFLDPKEAQRLVNEVQIIHPYGTLGNVWGESQDIVHFAPDKEYFDADLSSNAIRTFHEGVADPTLNSTIKSLFASSGSVVFSGFGFLKQNVDLIRPSTEELHRKPSKKIFATVKDLSKENVEQVSNLLEGLLYNGDRTLAAIRPLDVSRTCAMMLEANRAELFGF
jgi:SIR2-like domain